MKTVNEVSKLTGISVRTLHHYDEIGLLKPTEVTEAGYYFVDSSLGALCILHTAADSFTTFTTCCKASTL